MILFAHAIGFVSVFAALAHAAAVSPAAGECQTIGCGILSTMVNVDINHGSNQPLDLNTAKELTFGNGAAVLVSFQACPNLPPTSFSSTGRLVVQPISSNRCLTITNPSSPSGPYYVKAKKCTSNTLPSAAQTWGYGFDTEAVIFYTGSKPCVGGAGVALNDDTTLKLASRKRIELTCTGVNYESLTLTNMTF